MEAKTNKCPQCKEDRPVAAFEHLPSDPRCDMCITTAEAMRLYDVNREKAGKALARVMDAVKAGKGLKPLERMVSQFYDAWGGSSAFTEDLATWIKDLASNPRSKGAAVQAAMKMLALHGRIDRMKFEDDWRQMDDASLRQNLKLKMAQLLAEVSDGDGKKTALEHLMGSAPEVHDAK